jgi:SAM-dependent methyltransferase
MDLLNKSPFPSAVKNSINFAERYYPESKFGGFTNLDGTVNFYSRVNALVQPEFVLLDYGCGRGEYADDQIAYRRALRIFKHRCRRVIGVDVDENARENPFLDDFYQIDNGKLPLADHSVDMCICDWVLEHIENPDLFFNEMRRIIRPGGYLCIRTTNRWSYISVVARIIKEKYHEQLLSKAQPARNEIDIFPKYFRCNSINKLKIAMAKISCRFVVYGYEAEPAYLNFSGLTYLIGVYLHKLTPEYFRTTIITFAKIS